MEETVTQPIESPFFRELGKKLARSNIPALDGLRAVAVFLVIFYHFGLRIPGAHGVLAFFVLSGFLITWLLLKENDKTGTISIRSFYIRRVLRIFPAFYAFWLLCVGLLLLYGYRIPWAHASSAFFYVSDYYNALVRPPESFVDHTWSLAIEEQFYLLWPTVFYVLRRDRKRLAYFLTGLILAVWVYRALLQFVFHVNQGYIYAAFDTRLDQLMMGCLLAVVIRQQFLSGFWSWLCRRVYMPAITLALLVFSILCGYRYGSVYRDVIGFAIDPLLVAILIVQLIWFSTTLTWGWIEWSWMRYLGRISYSLYLYQQVTLHPLRRLFQNQPVVVQLVMGIAGTVTIATLSYYVIERPFLKLKDRFTIVKPLHAKAATAKAERVSEAGALSSGPMVKPATALEESS